MAIQGVYNKSDDTSALHSALLASSGTVNQSSFDAYTNMELNNQKFAMREMQGFLQRSNIPTLPKSNFESRTYS